MKLQAVIQPNEEVRVGDIVRYLAPHEWVTVVEIQPYEGPLADLIFAIAKTRPGVGFSLERGGYSEVIRGQQ